MKHLAVFTIRIYRVFLSPLLPANTCRFYPTCSEYSLEAFHRHGIFQGFIMTVKRLARCHPFNPGGYDPIQ